MPNPCGPWSDSPESFRTMRLYLGRFLLAALFSALLLAVFFAAMSLRSHQSQKLRNCNKHRLAVAYRHLTRSFYEDSPDEDLIRRAKRKGAPVEPGRLKWVDPESLSLRRDGRSGFLRRRSASDFADLEPNEATHGNVLAELRDRLRDHLADRDRL